MRDEKNSYKDAVLVTGTNRGLGLGFVDYYLKNGSKVVAAVRNKNLAKELLELEEKHAGALLVLEMDVSNEDSIVRFIDQLGAYKATLSLAINNAAIAEEEEFGKWKKATFESHFLINTIGPALVSQAILPFLQKGASLVQISSGMGSVAWNINPKDPLDAYAASKSALHSITARMAEKLREQKIVVVAINPGWVRTRMGGTDATSSVTEAILNLTRTIDRITLKDSGRFISETGESIPW
ncbi:MAG: SDR family NAD(P)-dependent oxidoreductase [Flavobacteriaceae bacterium]